MKVFSRLRAGVVGSLCLLPAVHATNYAIEHVTLIDGTGHAPRRDMPVTIEGDRISAITPSALVRNTSSKKIDGKGKFLIPGLMDVHIHLRGGFNVEGKVDAAQTPVNREEGVQALASFLYAGVTTVYDAGNRAEHSLPLRADERAEKILSLHDQRGLERGQNGIEYCGSTDFGRSVSP